MARKSKGDGPKRGAHKRLAEVVESLDKARAKRDRAQARVEALEALAEELATQVAADATAVAAAREEEAAASAGSAASVGVDSGRQKRKGRAGKEKAPAADPAGGADAASTPVRRVRAATPKPSAPRVRPAKAKPSAATDDAPGG